MQSNARCLPLNADEIESATGEISAALAAVGVNSEWGDVQTAAVLLRAAAPNLSYENFALGILRATLTAVVQIAPGNLPILHRWNKPEASPLTFLNMVAECINPPNVTADLRGITARVIGRQGGVVEMVFSDRKKIRVYFGRPNFEANIGRAVSIMEASTQH